MNIKGTLIVKQDTEQVNDKFQKRIFIIEVDGKYPQKIPLQLTQDRCGELDQFELGDNLNIEYNLRGWQWNKDGKENYGVNLDAWAIEKVGVSFTGNSDDIIDDEITF